MKQICSLATSSGGVGFIQVAAGAKMRLYKPGQDLEPDLVPSDRTRENGFKGRKI